MKFLTVVYRIPKALAPDCILDFMSYHSPLHSLHANKKSVWSSFTMTSSYPSLHLCTCYSLYLGCSFTSNLQSWFYRRFWVSDKISFPQSGFLCLSYWNYLLPLLMCCIALFISFGAFFLVCSYIAQFCVKQLFVYYLFCSPLDITLQEIRDLVFPVFCCISDA